MNRINSTAKPMALKGVGRKGLTLVILFLMGLVSVGTDSVGAVGDPTLLVTNFSSGTVSLVSTTDDTVTNTIAVGSTAFPTPETPAVTSDGTLLYVPVRGDNEVAVINIQTGQVIATPASGNLPFFAAVTPDDSEVYVANLFGNSVTVISVADNSVITTIDMGGGSGPRKIIFS